MTRGRLTQIGDSAFVARPHIALGVGKAAADALALTQALATLPSARALDHYQHARLAIVQYGRRLGALME